MTCNLLSDMVVCALKIHEACLSAGEASDRDNHCHYALQKLIFSIVKRCNEVDRIVESYITARRMNIIRSMSTVFPKHGGEVFAADSAADQPSSFRNSYVKMFMTAALSRCNSSRSSNVSGLDLRQNGY